jgi:hypothetical protein
MTINVYCCLQDEIQHEETTANIKFLFVECGPLKQTLTAHCELWKTKLTGLLNNLAAAELRSLHEYFRCVAGVHVQPTWAHISTTCKAKMIHLVQLAYDDLTYI